MGCCARAFSTMLGRKAVKRDTPMSQIVPGTPEAGAATVLPYVNFSQIDTCGYNWGLSYFLSSSLSLALHYS